MAEKAAGKQLAPIIIKKVYKKSHGGHHGGAWKIAYADFVTAMMAFFLLMWLLSYADPGTKAGIAEYFNRPLKGLQLSGPGAAPTMAPKTIKEKIEAQKKADQKSLEGLKAKLQALVEQNPRLKAYKNQIKIEITSEGMRVQIVDQKNRPMFAVGSAILLDDMKVILDQIGKTLNEVGNPISIAGHTDALQYAGGGRGYSNWELSSERANAARRELISGGMRESKVMQVRGLAGSVPLMKDLTNPSNRRISIVVLNAATVIRLKADGSDVKDETTASDTPAAVESPAPVQSSAAEPAKK